MATAQNPKMSIKKQGKMNQSSKYDKIISQYDTKSSSFSQRQLDKQVMMHSKPYQLNGSILDLKQHTIKQLDDKISSILTKYDQQNKPLSQRHYPQSRKGTKSTVQNTSISLIPQYEHKHKINPLLKLSQNGQNLREQSMRVRQRSKLIFEKRQSKQIKTTQYQVKSKYDIQIQMLNDKIKKTQETKKKLNIEPSQVYLGLTAKNNNYNSISKNQQSIRNQFYSNKDTAPSEHLYQKSILTKEQIPKGNQVIEAIKTANSLNCYIQELAQVFCSQIVFDEQFRNLKIWFTFSNQPQKWKKLEEKLISKGYKMSSQFCRSVFQSSMEQHNPFYRWSIINFEEGIEKLLATYSESQKNWQKTIKRHWTKKQLKEESLKQHILPQSNKLIQIQDLVQFTNHQTGKYFRSRDLWLIFKRLTCKCSKKLTLQGLIDQITTDQGNNS